jgi:hypothetical protein
MTASPNTPNSTTGGNEDSSSREKLVALRNALLRIHKTLLEMERHEYESEYGAVSVGELFRLVVDHTRFAWLHSISEFVVRIDEALASKEPLDPDFKMFTPTESGDAFQKKYFAAVHSNPNVVMDHAELARLFNNEPPESGAA